MSARYVERGSGEYAEPTHWLYGVSTTALSVAADAVERVDVATRPLLGTTPARLFAGVFYLLDEEGDDEHADDPDEPVPGSGTSDGCMTGIPMNDWPKGRD
jgi:hypothetical protein